MPERYTLAARLLHGIIVMGFVCTALVAPSAADGKRLTTEQEFRELVVGRQLTGDHGTVLLYTSDGRMAGASRGKRIEGTWQWEGATLCRTATWGTQHWGAECMALFVIGDLVILARDEGRGRAFALRFPSTGHPRDVEGELFARGGCC